MGDQLAFFFLLAAFLFVLGDERDEGKLQVDMKTNENLYKGKQKKFLAIKNITIKSSYLRERKGLQKTFITKKTKTNQIRSW